MSISVSEGPWEVEDRGEYWGIVNVETGQWKKIGPAGYKRGRPNYYDRAKAEAIRRNKKARRNPCIQRNPDMTDYYEEIRYEKYGPGKFSNNVDEWVYQQSLDGGADEEIGESEGFGWYGLMQFEEPVLVEQGDEEWEFKVAILNENSQGFVEVEYFEDEQEGLNRWASLEEEYRIFMEPQPEEGDYFIAGARGGGQNISQYGKVLATYTEWEDIEEFIRDHANENKFWPSVWQISDHGNEILVEDFQYN
jgi:hypothetical protein